MAKMMEAVAALFLARGSHSRTGYTLMRLTPKQTAWLFEAPMQTGKDAQRAALGRFQMRSEALRGVDPVLRKYFGRGYPIVLEDGTDCWVHQFWHTCPAILIQVHDSAEDRAAMDAVITERRAEAAAEMFF